MLILTHNRGWFGRLCNFLVCNLFLQIFVMSMFVDVSFSTEKVLDVSSTSDIVINDATPGDILYVPDGIYSDVIIRLEDSGVSGNPIFLKAKTPGNVVFRGVSSIKILSDYIVVSGFKFENVTDVSSVEFIGAKYSRLTDCAFMDCSAPRYSSPWIVSLKGGSQFNRVDNCLMQGNISIGMGVRIQEGDTNNVNNKFDHNYFNKFVKVRDNVQEAIQIGQLNFNLGYYANTIVEFNLFDNASGEGEYGEIISNKSSGNTYKYNTFKDCLGSFSLRTGGGCTVEGNWFFNVTQGVKVIGDGHKITDNYFEGGDYGVWLVSGTGRGQGSSVGPYEAADNVLVAGNSFYNCKKHAIYLGQGLGTTVTYEGQSFTRSYQPLNCKIYNNALLGSTVFLLRPADGISPDDYDFKSNLLSPAEGSNAGYLGVGASLADLSFGKVEECFRVNVSSQSLLVDKGFGLEGSLSDIDGQLRVSSPEVGCDEFVRGATSRAPLTVSDVGPTWMRTTVIPLVPPVQNLKIIQ